MTDDESHNEDSDEEASDVVWGVENIAIGDDTEYSECEILSEAISGFGLESEDTGDGGIELLLLHVFQVADDALEKFDGLSGVSALGGVGETVVVVLDLSVEVLFDFVGDRRSPGADDHQEDGVGVQLAAIQVLDESGLLELSHVRGILREATEKVIEAHDVCGS